MFENAVTTAIQDCPPQTVFLAAVSGGADSMALLTALNAVVKKDPLYCIHVEHGIRPPEESRGDAEFVRDFCAKHGINCHVESIPHGKIETYARRKGSGVEAAARLFRRRALFRHAAQLGENVKILIAHTKDDMLETALMRVLRGAGPAGLAAMPAKKGRIIRPLLSVTRAEVIAYLTEKDIPWREDSTNADGKFLRNRIRHQLIPLLNESFPSWKSNLAAMADTQSLTAAFIAGEASRRVEWEISPLPPDPRSPAACSHFSEEINNRAYAISDHPKNALNVSRVSLGVPSPHSLLPTPSLFTDEEKFFSQPEIVREEALFQGIDLLINRIRHGKLRKFTKAETGSFAPRRSVIRRFCEGAVKAADLGRLRVVRKDGKICLFYARKACFERGFSLLIK